jgi:hypothetical protein
MASPSASHRQPLHGKLTTPRTGARSPLLGHFLPGASSPWAPASCTPTTSIPVLPSVLHYGSCSSHRRFGGDKGGAGGRDREAKSWQYASFILFAEKEKSCLLPVPCSCSPRHGTAEPCPTGFPLSLQTPGSTSPTRAPSRLALPRLGGAHPSYLTAQALPFNSPIGCAGKWGWDQRKAASLIGLKRYHSWSRSRACFGPG